MSYSVCLTRPAQKQLDPIPKTDYRRIYNVIKSLEEMPRPDGYIKLDDDIYRIRCGAYRVIYSILDAEKMVLILKVARRSEKTYRNIA